MKRTIFCLLGGLVAAAGGAVPAFPGCEGWGCETPGGRGGRVIYVTSLNDSGPGSLRDAIETKGPRMILFTVSGVIRLQTPLYLGGQPNRDRGEDYSFVTIAGQSAPGGGVVIADFGLLLVNDVHDVVIQHLRFRNAQRNVDREMPMPRERGPRGRPGMSPRERPGMSPRERPTYRHAGDPSAPRSTGDGIDLLGARRVVIDHCSFSWATDENVSMERFTNTDITVSHSIIAEVLWYGGHEAGDPRTAEHSRGMNLSRGADRVAVHHNFFMSNNWRNPHLMGCMPSEMPCRSEWAKQPVFDVRCNVVYNWGEKGVHISGGAQANVVDNLFLRGPGTEAGVKPILFEDREAYWKSAAFVEGNVDSSLGGANQRSLVHSVHGHMALVEAPFRAPRIAACRAEELRDQVGSWGAQPADPVDQRLLAELRSGTGSIGAKERTHDSPTPEPERGVALPDSDRDGLPDAWEKQHGFDPTDASDAARDEDGDGWTNLEEYLHRTEPRPQEKPESPPQR